MKIARELFISVSGYDPLRSGVVDVVVNVVIDAPDQAVANRRIASPPGLGRGGGRSASAVWA
jgi:hypothetical protein